MKKNFGMRSGSQRRGSIYFFFHTINVFAGKMKKSKQIQKSFKKFIFS